MAICRHYLNFYFSSNFYIMKKNKIVLLLSFIFLLSWKNSISQLNIDSLSHIDYQQLHGANLNDVWGYVDELGNEYAIVGTSKGTSIVDVTIPTNPIEVFWLPGSESIWRDPCVYGNYAYVTTEAEDGLLIIDLTPLPQSTNLTSTIYTGPTANPWQSAHTCFLDENGFAYIFGANRGNGGVIILDVNSNPMNPTEVGIYDNWYIHDGYARNDTLYAGHIYDGFFSLIDVSDKANPVLLGTQITPSSFTHNIWPSENGKYVYTTDEVSGAFIGVYDITDPTNISEVDRTQHSPGAGVIPHNTHVKGDYLITSYYSDGVVIHDITYPDNVIKVGQYDTYPGQTIGFDGCWGVYPFLPSGTILAADITKGLFILGPSYQKASYLEGIVTDANTNNALGGVSVQITTNDQVESTSVNGEYKTGIFGTGTYSVSFQKVGYYPKTETVQLIQGQVVTLSTQLIPIPPYNLEIQVYESGGIIPISDAKIKLNHPLIEHTGVTNALGQESLTLFYQDGAMYHVQVGKWGYITSCFDSAITESTVTLVVEMEKGFYDDFEFDFGWTVVANAETGNWERGIPNPTNNTVPGVDADFDCGDFSYVTGNKIGLDPLNDDVHNGFTELISPTMDLTSLSNPHVNFARSFYCFYGPGLVDDTLKIIFSNGTDEVVIDEIGGAVTAMNFEYKSIPISGLLPITSNMFISIYISDFAPDNNVTEAAFDLFSITDYNASEIIENKITTIKIYPNPSSEKITVEGLTKNKQIKIVDLKGNVLVSSEAKSEKEFVDISCLDNGVYFVCHEGRMFKLIKY
jgi:choice-of-anchor B domain-containing protein